MSMLDMQLLHELSQAHGVSGHEDEVIKTIAEHVKAHTPSIHTEADPMMNLFLTYNRPLDEVVSDSEPRIMLDAHSDEVGLMVQSIDEKGLINFIPIGGWIPTTLPAHRVHIKTKTGEYITGIVSSKPPHFLSEAERNAALKMEHLKIDVGASSRDEAVNDFGIDVGQPIVPVSEFDYNAKTGLVRGKAFDNRIGCFCLTELMKKLDGRPLPVEVVGAVAAQEEIGTRGAKVTAERVKPALAIVFEGTPADDTVACREEMQGAIGKGVQIRCRDNSYLANYRLVQYACELAEKEGIAFQKAVRTGGGTNAGPIHLSGQGVPTLVLGVPVRYIHTHNGFLRHADILTAVKLAETVVMNFPAVMAALTVLD